LTNAHELPEPNSIKKELLALGYSAFQGLNALKHNEYQRKQLFL
jgi:hypothetical protein